MVKYKIDIEVYADTDRKVGVSGNSGRVFLPKQWKGKKVKVLLMEPLDE